MGYGIGKRILELISCRDRITKRETRIIPMLQYLTSVIWRYLFNKDADSLLETKENKDECISFPFPAAPIPPLFSSLFSPARHDL
jgi:hypothetical protein